MFDSWSDQFYGKHFLFQCHQLDLNKLYRKFTFFQVVILQKTDATMEKSKKYIYKKQYWIDKIGGPGSRRLRPAMGCNAIGRRPLLLDNGK